MTKNNHPGKLVVDLDGVLAGPKPRGGSYADCECNELVARRLRELKALGWTIAIHTSRNVRTHEHNIGRMIATTVPEITDWLGKHNIPYDEVWPNKPWPGHVGVYVDDRAVRPQELIELTTSELLAHSRAAFYDPSKPLWRAENEQTWFAIDLRELQSALFSGSLVTSIKNLREQGARTAIILSEGSSISIGQDEELRRLGARWFRFERRLPADKVSKQVKRELVLDNLVGSNADIKVLKLESEADSVTLSSRHFNSVDAYKDRVIKTAHNHAPQRKLQFEYDWLTIVDRACESDNIVITDLTERTNGYMMDRAAGGSLNAHLLRATLDHVDVHEIADEIERIWSNMDKINADLVGEKTNHRTLNEQQLSREHQHLIVEKSSNRLNALHLILRAKYMIGMDDPWVVNGVPMGTLRETVRKLIAMIPPQKNDHRGVWHGDFCPGNIVMSERYAPTLMLIDPRGTIDDQTIALYGDRRYDLGKLAHALRWGYDVIVEGWRDVQWENKLGGVDVKLRLWDESDPDIVPARLRVWDNLVQRKLMAAGDTHLDSPIAHAITALQLITCTPLHKDDPERVMALLARGLEVAQYALDEQELNNAQSDTGEEAVLRELQVVGKR